ncbi:Hypothetical predicted protein [Paramuricea clavata]|uniref:Uncharacterized protein n=1 Tax=Paramuricea clavata TaxID=317549 RepID=A0A7D9IZJ3_PARCT|nr:Hypothetical predicted protein [Paramuricea clavata]
MDTIAEEIKYLENLAIPICYVELPMNQYSRLKLHAFGDASELAYASALYLQALSVKRHVSTSLFMSKTRIAPVKRVTLPRLELTAAVITARLCTYVRNALDCPIDRTVCWTDNSSTIHWFTFTMETICCESRYGNSIVRSICLEILPWTNVPTRGMSSSELKERQL